MRYRWLAPIALLLTGPALAAQFYVQPVASVETDYASNITLDPTSQIANEAYVADLATYIGIATPDSDTNIRPRLHYEDYPKQSVLNQFDGMLDFNTSYKGTRSHLYVFGRYDHLNETEAEIPSAQFNDVNPVAPTNPTTGFVYIGVTQNNAFIVPKYSYDLTQLVTIGASGTFQDLTFSQTNQYYLVDYRYYQGQLFISRDLGPRTGITLAAYESRYQATSLVSNATAQGGLADFSFKTSPRVSGDLSVEFQHTLIDARQPVVFQGSENTWGATYSQVWQQKTGQFQLQIGRTISPSGGGGLYVDEQLQAQYQRNLSDRFSYTFALLLLHSQGLSANVNTFNRNYGTPFLSVKWMITRTWFIEGGGGYFWQKFSTDLNSATDGQAFVRFGYQGLPRQQ